MLNTSPKVIFVSLVLSIAICAFKSTGDGMSKPSLSKLQVPPYPSIDSTVTFIPPGQIFTTVITNNSTHLVRLYPYLNRAGMEQIAWGDSFLLAYLHSQIAGLTDYDSIRLKLVQIVGTKIEKTDLFAHGQTIFQPSDYYLSRSQNSLMGALDGAYHKICSGFIKNGIALLVQTGYFNYDNIKVVNLAGHTTGTFLYKGDWVFFDFDPQEPFFMIRDSANKSGYASALDIHKNPRLITEDQRYYYVNDVGEKKNLCLLQTISKYQAHFDSVYIARVQYAIVPLDISGVIILPSGASIISSYRTPYILGPASYKKLFSSFGTTMDSAYSVLAGILCISVDSAVNVVTNAGLSVEYTTHNWQPTFSGVTPTLKIVLPATSDTLKIPSDISFPGYILRSTINIYPDIFQAGQIPVLWCKAGAHVPAPEVTDNEVHYLAEPNEYIPPHPDRNDTITVSYNPRVFDFGAGFKLGYRSKTDSISVQVFKNDSIASQQATYTIKNTLLTPKTIIYENLH